LDGEHIVGNKVCFTSFPRSGNSFLRKYLQLLTGLPTGSDNSLHTDTILQMQGMKGEDLVDDTCWIVKSHFPWIMPFAPRFTVNKILMIVRNPTESCVSWMHLCNTANHSTKIPFDVPTTYPNYWQWWVRDCMKHMKDHYQTYLDDARFRRAPILFVRFEDLVVNPEPELMKIMSFLLNEKDLEGSNAQRRVREVIAMGRSATVTYSLKDTTTKFDSNRSKFTQEQQAWIKEEFKEMLHFFGYAKVPQDPENTTGFTEYDGQDEHLNRVYKGYERQNEDMINWVSTMTDQELDNLRYLVNDQAKDVPLLDFKSNEKAVVTIHNHFEQKMYGRTF